MKTHRFALIGAAGFVAPRHMQAIQSVGGDLVAALHTARKAVRVNSGHIGALNALGSVLLQMGRPAEAIRALRRAVEVDSTKPELYANLGRSYEASGSKAAAIDCYEAFFRHWTGQQTTRVAALRTHLEELKRSR